MWAKGKIICIICLLCLIITAVFILFGRKSSFAEQSLPIVVTGSQVNQPLLTNSTQPNVIPTENVTNSGANSDNKSSVDTGFLPAAARNSQLKFNIQWAFGGKSQRGWYIYAKLISHLIGVEASVDSPEFAAALARWQETTGLPPNGVLDKATLAVIVTHWQENRSKLRSNALPNELTTAPATDFYDPLRAEELRRLERNTYAAYKKMVAAAIADKSLNLATDGKGNLAPTEKFLKIISAFRSREYQNKLRRESPNSGRAGLAVNSPHFTGRALDIYVGGDPVETKDTNRAYQVLTPVYRWLVKNAAKFGFKPYFYEPWHWEYAPD